MTAESQRYCCLIRNWRNATSKHACPEARGSSPTAGLTLLWAHNPFRGNSSNWHISQEEAGRLIPKRRHGNGKGRHGRPLKRILDLWDRNGATGVPNWCYLDDDDEDDDDVSHSSSFAFFAIFCYLFIQAYLHNLKSVTHFQMCFKTVSGGCLHCYQVYGW